MAERLEGFDFGRFMSTPKRRSPYPLDEWMDGSIWLIWRGVDFDGTVHAMQSRLHHYARTRDVWVQTRATTDGKRDGVVFRFRALHPLMDEQR